MEGREPHESSNDTNNPDGLRWSRLRGAAPPPGNILFGRYTVIREIGRGGMGLVLLARDSELGINIALKMIPEMLVDDDESLDDLKQEVLRGMTLTHPGIVRTHGFIRDESMAAIVMEYVDGGNFNDLKRLQPGACFDTADLLPWLEQLCPALDYAHFEIKIAHRDLKPRNLMYTLSGRIKVADFGISSTLGDSMSRVTMKGPSSGTPAYMSPQQVMGERPSHLDDIYGLGATLYELLTGKPPFYKGEIVYQVLECLPPPLSVRREELGVTGKQPIPRAWEDALASCLAKNPAHRPQSISEVLELLRASAAIPQPVLALPEAFAPQEEGVSTPRRHRRRSVSGSGWTVAAFVAILLLAASVLFVLNRRQVSEEKPDPGSGPAVNDESGKASSSLPEAPRITSPSELLPGRVGFPCSRILTAAGETPPWAWSINHGTLPEGLAMDGTGLISGIPDAASDTIISVSVAGKEGVGRCKQIRLVIDGDPEPPAEVVIEIPKTDLQAPVAPRLPEPVPLPRADKENPHENTLGMRFVPAGNEDVLLSIWLTRIRDFRAFVTVTQHDAKKDVYSVDIEGKTGWFLKDNNWENPGQGFAQTDDHPVCGVSWNDAKAFCKWLTEKELKEGKLTAGLEYRLPSDAEWRRSLTIEKDAGKALLYPWGDGWPPPKGNFAGLELLDSGVTPRDWPKLEIRDYLTRTSRVDKFAPNSFGIYDAFGNLWQFCEDSIDTDPAVHLMRGGSWATGEREELKLDKPPKKRAAHFRVIDAGFRCVIARSK